MSMYSQGGSSHPDLLIGLIYTTCVFLGLILNTLVLLFNLRRPYTIPKFLFGLLSATDFLTSGLVALFGAAKFLQPGVPRCSTGEDPSDMTAMVCQKEMPPSTTVKLYGIAAWFLTQSSGVLTALLATCRLIQIMKPFTFIKIRLVGIAVAVYAGVTLTLLFSWFITDDVIFTYYNLSLWPLHNRLLNGVFRSNVPRANAFLILISLYIGNIVGQLIALTASGLAIVYLCKSPRKKARTLRSRRTRKRSSTTILITNIGAILQLVGICIINKLIFSNNWHNRTSDSRTRFIILAVCNMLLPVVLSVFNPIVFIMYTPKFTERFKWPKRGPLQVVYCSSQQVCKVNYMTKSF